MSRKLLALVAAAACALSLTGNAFAANTGWLRVINVKTDNVAAYVQELDKGRAMMKRLGVNVTTRIWRATYAGPNTGMIVVSQEFPSWQAFVDSPGQDERGPAVLGLARGPGQDPHHRFRQHLSGTVSR